MYKDNRKERKNYRENTVNYNINKTLYNIINDCHNIYILGHIEQIFSKNYFVIFEELYSIIYIKKIKKNLYNFMKNLVKFMNNIV